MMKKLVIVGGGMAGWIAAVALARKLEPTIYEISIVESSHIGNISVGESVLPSVISFLRDIGMDEEDLVRKTKAGLKLGIQFRDWLQPGTDYFHPFGGVGQSLDGINFFHYWLKARARGDMTPLVDYYPAAVMAKFGKCTFPFDVPLQSPLAGAGHALHLNADLVVRYLRDSSEKLNVRRITGHVVRVHRKDGGNIESIELNSRRIVEGDFFLDCSGFRGLLIGETLGAPYKSWKRWLPCDRAVVVQSLQDGRGVPYMISRARESGWSWHIPLQNRISCGYVFSSEHCSDQQAVQTLLDSLEQDPVIEPRLIPIRSGVRKQFWKKNCVALGLAGGFLEPLESTAIHLIIRGVQYLMEWFPDLTQDQPAWPRLARLYNAGMRRDYQEIRDFIILHYHATKRTDTEFWRNCQSSPIPEGLEEQIGLFKSHGQLQIADQALFRKSSWQAVFTGMGVIPRSFHPFANGRDFDMIHQQMQACRDELEETIQALPRYRNSLSNQ